MKTRWPLLALITVLAGGVSACERPAAEPIRRTDTPPAAWTGLAPSPEPQPAPGEVTIPFTPRLAPEPRKPFLPRGFAVLDDRGLYGHDDKGFRARRDAELRALLGNRREPFYDDEPVWMQVSKGHGGYSELMSAPGGRRLIWGYRKHAGPTQYALLYAPNRRLAAVAVREIARMEGYRLTIFLPAGRKGRAEIAVLRDWALYMDSITNADFSDAGVRVVRMK